MDVGIFTFRPSARPDGVGFAIFARGARVDVMTKGLGSPLHLACSEGPLDGVKMLVAAGADVRAKHPLAGTPVYAACTRPAPWRRWRGEEAAAEEEAWREGEDGCARAVLGYLLRECGADVNQGGGDFGSALGAACAFCSVETVEVLLEAGARVDVCDACGRYPVHLAAAAAACAGVEVFGRMCDAGSDWRWRDKSGRSVLHVAVQSGSVALVERVLEVTDDLLNAADVHGWTPLHYAARGCHGIGAPVPSSATWSKEVIQMLLDKGADIWSVSNGVEQEWSPLKLARYHGAPQDVLDLFTPAEKTGKDGRQWDEKKHLSMKAFKTSVYCDCCLFNIQGLRYKCQKCDYFELCYKCNRLATILHPGHQFEELGPEFELEKSSSSEHDTSDGESDGEDESDEDEDEGQEHENSE